jgi:hypothetical protein
MTVPMRATHKVNVALGLVGAVAAACAMAGAIAACSSNSSSNPDGGGSSASNCTTTEQMVIKFSPMYSAYDGMHTYELPVVVNVESATLTASDMTAVGIQANQELSAPALPGFTGWTLTMRKAPPTPITLTAQVGNFCNTAQLTITPAQPSDWDIGNARYNNGASLHFPMFGGRGGGDAGMMMMGPPTGDGGSFFETADGGPACTSCHGPTATMGFLDDVSHTPEQTGGFSDMDLINIVVNGVVPDGGYFDPNIISMANWNMFHRWADIQQDQYLGMIVYLRSLTPAAQTGKVNLGGFVMGPRDAGGGG